MSIRSTVAPTLGFVAGALLCADAVASLPHVSARDRVTQAELIVDARVVGVETRLSSVIDATDVELPHTFVTFEILRTFKGSIEVGPEKDRLTLRFEGGPDGRGRELVVSGVPSFRPGDRDILFIRGNGESLCPLVGWEQGRLRVVDGELFDDLGQELWLTADGEFLLGPPRLDLSTLPYGPLPEDAPEDAPHDDEDHVFAPPAGSLRPDLNGFHAFLDLAVDSAYLAGMSSPAPARSVDSDAPFRVAALLAAAPPVDRRPTDERLFRGEHDEREAELIRRRRDQK